MYQPLSNSKAVHLSLMFTCESIKTLLIVLEEETIFGHRVDELQNKLNIPSTLVDFSLILLGRTMALGSTQPLIKMSIRG
jgi:hypothetical protein